MDILVFINILGGRFKYFMFLGLNGFDGVVVLGCLGVFFYWNGIEIIGCKGGVKVFSGSGGGLW